MTFEDRKWYFQKIHETGQLRLDLAIDTITGMYAGYLRLFGISGAYR